MPTSSAIVNNISKARWPERAQVKKRLAVLLRTSCFPSIDAPLGDRSIAVVSASNGWPAFPGLGMLHRDRIMKHRNLSLIHI